jgi:predicted permease
MGWGPVSRRSFVWPRRSAAQIGRDVDDELAHHLELVAEELVSNGWRPEEARREARRRFGDLAHARRAMIDEDRRVERRIRLRTVVESLREDVVFAVRSSFDRPGHTAVTVATLAIGMTTATIFFGAVDSILLQPVALNDPERVVELWGTEPAAAVTRDGLAPATVRDLGERIRSMSAVAAAQPHSFDLVGPSGPISVNSWIVSEGYFDVLAARPAAGRLFGPVDFDAGSESVVVITHSFWMHQYGGDVKAVGATLALDDAPHVVVGVLPPDFPVRSRDLFVPRTAGTELWESRYASFFSAYGRLRPGVPIETARAELADVAAQLERDFPDANRGRGFAINGLRASLVEDVSQGLWILFAAAILILVISCVNAAGLLLAQAAGRTRELAIRAAVGAGQGRLVRQLFTESALLAGLAAAIAVPLAAGGLGLFRAYSPPGTPRIAEVGLDPRTVAFSVLAALTVALLAGLVPALRVARPDLYEVLKPGGRSGSLTPGAVRLRSTLVGAQVAIAVVLLVGGGLLLRSWGRMVVAEQGYEADGVAAVETHYWQFYPDETARAEFARLVIENLSSSPGVEAAGVTTSLPLAAQIGNEDGEVSREGDTSPTTARWIAVTPGLLEALNISLLDGRTFGDGDAAGAEPVALLSREAARRLWPDGDAVGRTALVGADDEATPHRVVGIVTDVRFAGLETDPEPAVYVPHAQSPSGSVYFVVRTTGEAGIRVLREVLSDLQPSLVVAGQVQMSDKVSAARQPRRFSLMLLAAFGLTALLLTAVGLFGHLSHSIRSRERELGVRMALGAWPGRLVRAAAGQGVLLVVTGAVVGLLLAFGLSRFMAALLYEVAPFDPLTFSATALVVLGLGAAASYVPARRASRVDPAAALRVE